MPRRTTVIAFAVLTLAALGLSACGRTETAQTEPEGPFVPSQEHGTVTPASAYRLSGPYTHANLTVFLVHGPETLPAKTFLTLQEALEQKKAVVHETGSVGQLTVENLSPDEDLYIQSGDIVKGGKQDRTLPYDAVIAAKSGRVPIQSFCVEQGRWTKRNKESSEYFSSSSDNLGTSDLKRAAASPGQASQAEVWKNVARTQERLGKKLGESVRAEASATSLQLTLESSAVQAALDPFRKALGPVIDRQPDTIGYVTVVNGRVLSADVYASRALFRKLWPKLLSGSAVEAFLESDAGRAVDPVGEEAVRAFLAEGEAGEPAAEGVTERTYVQVRRGEKVMLFQSCDRSRENLVLHRSFLVR